MAFLIFAMLCLLKADGGSPERRARKQNAPPAEWPGRSRKGKAGPVGPADQEKNFLALLKNDGSFLSSPQDSANSSSFFRCSDDRLLGTST